MSPVNNMVARAIARRQQAQEAEAQAAQFRRSVSPPDPVDIFQPDHGITDGDIDPALRSLDGPEQQGPVPGAGRRRPRSNSLDADTADSRARKYNRFADECCDKFALRGARRALVRDFAACDLHQKLILMMSFIQRHETDTANAEVKAYLASAAFKKHASTLFQTALLAPHSKGYVNDLGNFIEDDMVRNHDLYKIKKIIVEDGDSRAMLNSHARTELTTLRNTFKGKLDKAFVGGLCLNEVMASLAPKLIEITDEHRARWAWMLQQHAEHRQQVANHQVKDSMFWTNIDKLLASMEVELKECAPERRDRDKTRAEVFAEALETYDEAHPPTIPAREVVDAPAWQVVLEQNIKKYHSYAAH